MTYTRDVLGKRVPAQTIMSGNGANDTATGYEPTLVSGQ
jgi:hypothetical protein